MERKKTQRIIGMLVVIALVVIMMPLLFGKNDMPPVEAKTINAPPFPDQKQVVADNTKPAEKLDITTDMVKKLNTSDEATDAANTQLNGDVPADNSAVAQEKSADNTLQSTDDEATNPTVKAKPAVTHEQAAKPEKTVKAVVASVSKQAGKPAWVVQMGVFKNKDNAQRLADKLRAAGFKAFTLVKGKSTRVYVGPEFKQALATETSNKVAKQLSLQGIVVSYKPLSI